MENPIDGIVPDFTVFGAEFTEWWEKVFAALWAVGIIGALVFVILGLVTMAQSGENPHDYSKGRGNAIKAGVSVALLAALGVIVGAIFAVAG